MSAHVKTILEQIKELDARLDRSQHLKLVPEVKDGNAIKRLKVLDKILDEKERKRDLGLRLFERIFYGSPIAIAVIDNDQKFRMANRVFEETLGYSEAELVGTTWMCHTHPNDIERDKRLAEETQKGTRGEYHIPKRYIRKDKTYVGGILHVVSFRHPGDGQICYLSHVIPEPLLALMALQIEELKDWPGEIDGR